MPTSVRVHWNKYFPSLCPLPCLILLGPSWRIETGTISFISQPDREVTAASEVKIEHMHTHKMETMQLRKKGDYILLI